MDRSLISCHMYLLIRPLIVVRHYSVMSSFVLSSSFLLALFASAVAVDFKHPEKCSKVKFVKVDVVKELTGKWFDFIHTYESEEDDDFYTCALVNLTYTKNQTGVYEKDISKSRTKSGDIVEETDEMVFPASYDGQYRNVVADGNGLLIYGILHKASTYYIEYLGYQNYTECEEMLWLITSEMNVPNEGIDKMKKYAEDMRVKLVNKPEACKDLQ